MSGETGKFCLGSCSTCEKPLVHFLDNYTRSIIFTRIVNFSNLKNLCSFPFPFSFVFSICLCASVVAEGQIATDSLDGRVNTINTAVPFLRISPDARSGAMGDVGVALSPDANAIFWNLSKLPFAASPAGGAVTYTPWLKELVQDVFLATVSGYKKLSENEAISGSLRYFSLGTIYFTDIAGNSQGQFRPREFAIDGGYARKLSDHWSVAVALRYIYSNLASGQTQSGQSIKPGQAGAGDISAFYTKEKSRDNGIKDTWNFGVAISNLGSKISYTQSAVNKDFIPTNLGIGTAYTRQFDQYNKITLSLDINKLLVPTPDSAGRYKDKSVLQGVFSSFTDAPGGFREELHELMYSSGVEYWYNDQFAVRAGYFNEHKTKGNRKYFTVGIGVKYNELGLNFSYLVPSGSGIQRNPLSNTLRFSLLYDFGNKKEKQ